MAFQLVLLGVVIGSNNLATALALGALGQARRWGRIILIFGAIEFLVPLLGLLLGRQFSEALGEKADWLAPPVFILMGMLALRSALSEKRSESRLLRLVTSWPGLLLLALSLSGDNLLVGFSLGLVSAKPLLVAGNIALFSMVFTLIGLQMGARLGTKWGAYADGTAGLLLIALGVADGLGWL